MRSDLQGCESRNALLRNIIKCILVPNSNSAFRISRVLSVLPHKLRPVFAGGYSGSKAYHLL